MVKTFVFSLTDYLLFLQRMSQKVKDKSGDLDERCLNFILQTTVPPAGRRRGRSIARILSLQAGREKHKIHAIAKFKTRILDEPHNGWHARIWNTIERYGTAGPTLRRTKPPANRHEMEDWKNFQVKGISALDWSGLAEYKRWISDGPKLPPALRGVFTPRIESLAVHWYLNKIPRNKVLRYHKDELKQLLSKASLNTNEQQRLEQTLYLLESKLHRITSTWKAK